MRWPRKGILIRLCIYVPLLAYFGWGALVKCTAESAPSSAAPSGPPPIKIIELTPEEAEARFGKLPGNEP